jgi:hypothetical protein
MATPSDAPRWMYARSAVSWRPSAWTVVQSGPLNHWLSWLEVSDLTRL